MTAPNSAIVTPATSTIDACFIAKTKANNSSEFECISCQKIPCNGMIYELGCGHGRLCDDCKEVVCAQQATCPNQTTRECDESVRDKLGKLQTFCPYSVPQCGGNSCTWSGLLSEWKNHALQCNHRLAECSKSSTKRETRTEEQHMESTKPHDSLAEKMAHIELENQMLKEQVARQEEKIHWMWDKLAQVMEYLDVNGSKSDGSVISSHPSESRSVQSSVDLTGTPVLLPAVPPPSVAMWSDTPSVSDDSQKDLLCMYWFTKQPCPNEDACPWLHGEPELLNRQNSSEEEWDFPKSKPRPTVVSNKKKICPYFLKGECRYGSGCWYSHEKDRKNEKEVIDDEKLSEMAEMETDEESLHAPKNAKPSQCGDSCTGDGSIDVNGTVIFIMSTVPCACAPGCTEMCSTLIPVGVPPAQF